MITIRITNAKEVVRQKQGRMLAWVGGLVSDLEDVVERRVMDEIRAALAKQGVQAIIEQVPEPGASGAGGWGEARPE